MVDEIPDNGTAVVKAEIGGYKFVCRIDFGEDRDAISENIIKYLGDHHVFLPIKLISEQEELKAIAVT